MKRLVHKTTGAVLALVLFVFGFRCFAAGDAKTAAISPFTGEVIALWTIIGIIIIAIILLIVMFVLKKRSKKNHKNK